MHTRQSVAVNPLHQNNVLSTNSGLSIYTPMLTTFVTRECFDECGIYRGPSLSGIAGHLSFAKNLGVVGFTSDIACSGNLLIGKGTEIHIHRNVLVSESIIGEGSLRGGDRSLIEAHAIVLDGDLDSGLSIKSKTLINIGGSLTCKDCVAAGAGITVGGDLEVGGNIECDNCDVTVMGDAMVSIGFDAVNVKVGGSISCHWLTASGSVVAGNCITALEDIRVNLGISAGGEIAAGWRIFAGLVQHREVRKKEVLIECAAVVSGKVACGNVRLRSRRSRKSL